MEDFINQSHCIDLSRFDGLLRKTDQIPFVIDFLPKRPLPGMEVGKDDIPAEGKERVIKLVKVPHLPANMKFHFRYGSRDAFVLCSWVTIPFKLI